MPNPFKVTSAVSGAKAASWLMNAKKQESEEDDLMKLNNALKLRQQFILKNTKNR